MAVKNFIRSGGLVGGELVVEGLHREEQFFGFNPVESHGPSFNVGYSIGGIVLSYYAKFGPKTARELIRWEHPLSSEFTAPYDPEKKHFWDGLVPRKFDYETESTVGKVYGKFLNAVFDEVPVDPRMLVGAFAEFLVNFKEPLYHLRFDPRFQPLYTGGYFEAPEWDDSLRKALGDEWPEDSPVLLALDWERGERVVLVSPDTDQDFIDYANGLPSTVVIDDMPFWLANRATAAVPPVMSRVKWNDRMLCDGNEQSNTDILSYGLKPGDGLIIRMPLGEGFIDGRKTVFGDPSIRDSIATDTLKGAAELRTQGIDVFVLPTCAPGIVSDVDWMKPGWDVVKDQVLTASQWRLRDTYDRMAARYGVEAPDLPYWSPMIDPAEIVRSQIVDYEQRIMNPNEGRGVSIVSPNFI